LRRKYWFPIPSHLLLRGHFRVLQRLAFFLRIAENIEDFATVFTVLDHASRLPPAPSLKSNNLTLADDVSLIRVNDITLGTLPMTIAILAPPSDPPLNQSHQRELAAAAERSRPIRRAARVATFNAWSTAILAAISTPFALWSPVGLLVFMGLSAVAWNEFRGRRRLIAADPEGAAILGWNQLWLLGMIAVYCLWSLYSNLWGGESLETQLQTDPRLGAAIGSIQGFDDLYRMIVVGLYGSVIALSVVFQGGNALYYFSRRKYVEKYMWETPTWVIDLQRTM